MNYPTFLNEVDRLASISDADSLRMFIHEMARTVPEYNREQFLTTLSSFCSAPAGNPMAEKEADADFLEYVDSLIEALGAVQNGDRALESEYNEEWDDWQDEADQVRFADPDHLLDDITAAVNALHQCLDKKEYAKGAELAGILSELAVQDHGECAEDEMDIPSLVDLDLLQIDVKKMIKEAVYVTCMGTPEAERAEAMVRIMDGFYDYSASLEDILQTGSDEIMLSSLLPSWIEALAKRPAKCTDRLLEEAQNMLQDEASLAMASCYAENHPALYLNILRTGTGCGGPDEMMRIGLRAVKEVPVYLKTRSSIALKTAEYALAAKERQIAEDCWMEAFRTFPTVENYLRIRTLSNQWEHYVEDARKIYTAYYESVDSWDRKSLPALMFFDERFEEMIEEYMRAGTGIGWSSTFMKQGIALLLMLMLKQSGNTDDPGMREMQKIAIWACSFDSESYCEGIDLKPEPATAVLFQDCLTKWKAQVLLPENFCETMLEKIDKWIALRVSAIMNANRRNYYDECAAFVAAYGEVLESRGNTGEKNRIMQRYQMEYSRRYAFREALRRFGLR